MTDERQGDEQDGGQITIRWDIPDTMRPAYANHLVVQHTASEFLLSFFSLEPPVLTGTPEEKKAELDALGSLPAHCVARVVVNPDRFDDFVRAMAQNLGSFKRRFREGDAG